MLQFLTTMPEQTSAVAHVSPVTGLSANEGSYGDSLLERVLASAQDAQDMSAQQVRQHFGQLSSGKFSTIALLELQVVMNNYQVTIQVIKSVAEDVGRSIQTLTQRS
ncbi:hypothetical protein AYM40_05600 [Paraburkholderia phytofirmans OLGA172]|uniref:Type III secretion protein n=1 Tax=Paraburkholderia phytofirmans OLGA172 TaxID=1417228 RepID=A0A160FJ25_9BURK|nr:hypothetical protein [Paraburkholderia phytofirmans]ANB71906.1 hypothetical protein AYM40_05600 [Paraburkholderia phytofirmans OLGA172]